MPSLIIAVGGTGKSVAAVYLRLAKFFHSKPADVLIVDMLFGNEEIDKLLDKEGIKQRNFMTPWPGGTRSLAGVRFAQVIGLDDGTVERPVAQTLFAEDELNTLVEKGMNARPIVGATVATRKFWGGTQDAQLEDFRQRVGHYTDIFVVGSITGGTGSGVMPTLGKWLTEDCGRPPHALLFLPWISIGAGSGDGPSDAVMQANAHAVLSYLKEVDPRINPRTRGLAPFKDYLLLGLPQQLEAGQSATAAEHPLHLAAATYLLYYDEVMTRNPEVQSGPFYFEVTSGGLRPGDMQPKRGFSLEQAINRQYWYREALLVMAGQQPDEAWDYMVPPLADKWLAWPALRETVRGLAVRAGGRGARGKVWAEMRKFFVEEAQNVKERLDWFSSILSRDTQRLVYNVSMDELEKQAGGFLRPALREASKAEVPALDAKVAWPEAARKAAEQMANDLFIRLEAFASQRITTGAAAPKSKVGSSTVFLPPAVHDPSGGVNDVERKPFDAQAFDALIKRYTGSPEAINMPDPQARRFQFSLTLSEALEEYLRDPSRPRNKWEESDALAQFTALLEGVIFGSLQLKLFDLEEFGFRSGFERRILGVLMDAAGAVYGGTDPETLFFPAPEAWDLSRGPLRRLAAVNVTQRDTDEGRYARALLKRFRDTFPSHNRPLWLKMIDEYLHQHEAPEGVDDALLRAGWKQVGPIQLRMPDNRPDVRYLPVYQRDFAPSAAMALSGDFALRDGEIHLRVNGSDTGRITYPEIRRAGVSLREMGAGAVSVLPGARFQVGAPGPQISYAQLRQHCNALLGDNTAKANSSSVLADPFKYPDAIRVPFQQDGLLADYFIQGGAGGRYGRQFLESARGRGATELPGLPPGQQPPKPVNGADGSYYFVDHGGVVYVERYGGREVKELSLLGQALWQIFIGEATQVPAQKFFIDAGGNVVLEYGGQRLNPGDGVILTEPNQQMRAADMRCLAWQLTQQNVDPLFKEAGKAWLAYFGLRPTEGQCARTQFDLGTRKWWRP